MIEVLDRPGLEIKGCQVPRAPLNSPSTPSNFCREPKDVLFSIQNTFRLLSEMQLGSPEKSLISSPAGISKILATTLAPGFIYLDTPGGLDYT